MSELEKNTAIYDKAKADREKLGAFKGKEKKALDTVMEKASSNIRTQQEILSKLGVSETKEAPRVLQELKAKDEKEPHKKSSKADLPKPQPTAPVPPPPPHRGCRTWPSSAH